MAWYEIYHKAVDWGQIGTSDKPGLNPPQLDMADTFALAWYSRHVTQFVKDFGLIKDMIKALEFEGTVLELFILKLSLIYETNLRIARQGLKDGKR